MKLKPSKREKKRYIVLSKEDAERAIALTKKIPEANPRMVFSAQNKKMICVNRRGIEKIKTILLAQKIKCLGISGTMKKAKRFF